MADTDNMHSSDLIAITDCALDKLVPGWRDMPPSFRSWIKAGLMIDLHKAYSNSVYVRTAMEDNGDAN